MYVGDTVFLAETEEQLQRLVEEVAGLCEGRDLRVNVERSKVMVFDRGADTS